MHIGNPTQKLIERITKEYPRLVEARPCSGCNPECGVINVYLGRDLLVVLHPEDYKNCIPLIREALIDHV